MALARMRTIKSVVEFFKQEDPETPVNEYMVRRLVKQGAVPVVYAGCKALINIDLFIQYLNQETDGEEPDKNSYGTIRKVCE